MKKSGSQKGKSPSQLIDARIKELGVKSQEIVPGDDSADRWQTAECVVLAMPVVAMQKTQEGAGALGGRRVGSGVRPLAEHRLDEAFGLAVGPGRVRTRPPSHQPTAAN